MITSKNKDSGIIKKGIWLYVFLLIFEGAFRKWLLPSFATPLLVIRDPVALILMAFAYQKGCFPRNNYLYIFIAVSCISFLATLLFGHKDLAVAVYGLRIFIIQVPFMFLIGKVFSQTDVIKMGKVLLWITIPMTVLIALQFYSPQSAWVNRGVGGDMDGAGFSGALGYLRPPGTFSFTNGTALFYGMLTPFILIFWLLPQRAVQTWLLIITSMCLLSAIPFSISRSLLSQVLISLLFSLFIIIRKPQATKYLIFIFSGLIILVVVLSSFPFLQAPIQAFTVRFETANRVEGGVEGVIIDRFLGGMYKAVFSEANTPLLGYGLGLGTNVGSQLLTGELTFLISEGEWGRLIGEMGFLLGMVIIMTRIAVVLRLGLKGYQYLAYNEIVPWLLFSFSIIPILQGQWAQPTSLGFSVLGGGLTIAAFKTNGVNNNSLKSKALKG